MHNQLIYAASGGTPPAPQNAVANGGGSQPSLTA